MDSIELTGVREYSEERPVRIEYENARPVIRAENEGGHNCTDVDLFDLIAWLKTNRPDWLA